MKIEGELEKINTIFHYNGIISDSELKMADPNTKDVESEATKFGWTLTDNLKKMNTIFHVF